jgi:pyruvate kinase
MRTKIFANVGPASANPEIIEGMLRAGVDVFRFNFGHGTYEQYDVWTKMIEDVIEKVGKPAKIFQDLSGPRMRVGKQPETGRILTNGQKIVFVRDGEQTNDEQITMTGVDLIKDVKAGERILLANGAITCMADKVTDTEIEATVVVGGTLMSNKAINVPDTHLTTSALTEKDRRDLQYGLTKNYPYIGISFVQDAKDINDLRALLPDDRKIIAKVERQAAINNIDEIIAATDIIMVARGDMGAEIPVEEVPFVQKMMINKCNFENTPSITATQMLTSMIENPFPTRAEVSDIANAILDGTSAVWLSDETAVGKYPVECVKVMRRICERTEEFQDTRVILD